MFRALSLFLVLLPTLLPAQDARWPREFKIRPVKVAATTDAASGNHVVRTAHFQIISQTEVNGPDFARFATVVESVPQLLEKFPLPLWAPPNNEQLRIILCKDRESFRKLGGKKRAVGWYDGHRQQVLIMADYFLNPPALQPTRLQPGPKQDLLVHEMVHMCMHGVMWRTPPWFSEGVAEYFAVCHKGNGWYTFNDVESAIRDHLRKSITIGKDGKLTLLPVEKILALDHESWLEIAQDPLNDNAYLPYATALLLTHYHFNGGKARRDKTDRHLRHLRTLTPKDETPPFPVGEDGGDIEARLIKFWSPKGLNLRFAGE